MVFTLVMNDVMLNFLTDHLKDDRMTFRPLWFCRSSDPLYVPLVPVSRPDRVFGCERAFRCDADSAIYFIQNAQTAVELLSNDRLRCRKVGQPGLGTICGGDVEKLLE